MKETDDVLRVLLARRDNYQVTHISFIKGRMYRVVMAGEHYNAVVLTTSFQYYEMRYHLAGQRQRKKKGKKPVAGEDLEIVLDVETDKSKLPTLIICSVHDTVVPIKVLSVERGNLAQPYELPEDIFDVAEQRRTRTGSQVLIGQYLCGIKRAQTLVAELPETTRKRYLSKVRALNKREQGKPVNLDKAPPLAAST
jgi:hypothetical protein